MKKVLFFALATMMLLGCSKKNEDAVLSSYEGLLSRMENVLDQEEEMAEEQFEAAISVLADSIVSLAEESQAVALRLFEDKVHYYLSLEQKARVFEAVSLDTLEAHGFGKFYGRYLGELNTQAGSPMIDIVCGTPKGDSLRLSEVVAAHDFVLLDFWASWCRPCRELMPELKNIYAEYKGKKLEIVSVSIDKDLDAWKNMIAQLELPWLHGAIQLAREGSHPDDAYGVSYIPTLFLIGHDGVIIAREPKLTELKMIIDK